MSLEDKIEKAVENYLVRPAQKELLDVLFNRLRSYEQSVQNKLGELRQALEEAIFFVKKDLGVPLDKPFDIKRNDDGSVSFVEVQPPVGQAAPVNVGAPEQQ